MEAAGSDDGRGPSWGHCREQTGWSPFSISSSSSGTIVSTGYTFTGSYLSSISTEAAKHLDLEIHGDMDVTWEETEWQLLPTKRLEQECFDASSAMHFDLELHEDMEDMPWVETVKKDTEFVLSINKSRRKKNMKQSKSLVQEIFGAPSTNCVGDKSVQERWLQQLGVGWVLHIADGGAPEWKVEHSFHASSWIRAFSEVTKAIRLVVVATLCPTPDRDTATVALPSICEEQEPETAESGNGVSVSDQFQFAHFLQKTLLKMLAFVHVIVAPNTKITHIDVLAMKLSTLLRVRSALSNSLDEIPWLPFHSPPYPQVKKILGEIVSLLSTVEGKASEAIWSTMEQIRTQSNSLTLQGSSDIHTSTPTVTNYIKFLEANYSLVAPIVSKAASIGKYVPQITQVSPLMSLVMEMVSHVEEENLANKSESFLDQALRFLFLLNNVYSLKQKLNYDTSHSSFQAHMVAFITHKVEGYMESYIQASWAPVLSCLFNPTPCAWGRNYSSLSKFESQFQKIYTTQKLWKVPDPKLRKTLRKAVIEKIIPIYTKYTEDNKVTNPKFSPYELEEMLQELFEG